MKNEFRRVRARLGGDLTGCARISAKFLAEERASMSDRNFRQEYLCEFMDMVSGVFDRDMVERAVSEDFAPLVIR